MPQGLHFDFTNRANEPQTRLFYIGVHFFVLFIFCEHTEKKNTRAVLQPTHFRLAQYEKSHRNAVAFLLPLLDLNQGPTD